MQVDKHAPKCLHCLLHTASKKLLLSTSMYVQLQACDTHYACVLRLIDIVKIYDNHKANNNRHMFPHVKITFSQYESVHHFML